MKVYTATYMRSWNEDRTLITKVFKTRGEAKEFLHKQLKDDLSYYKISMDNYDKDNDRYGDEENHIITKTDGERQNYVVFAYWWQNIVEVSIEQHLI